MYLHVLSVLVMLASGVIAGVFFDVALAMLPAFMVMTPGRFIYTNNTIGKGYHPTMPIVCTTTVVADLSLVFISDGSHRYLFLIATLLVAGTMVVSEFGNMRINRILLKIDPENVPPGWHDPRSRWRAYHLLRTALAVIAVAVNGTAVVLAG
ncbi:MAG TPA: DUF1772 domain-containing protein [Pseudonocardiaceae bacterium]